MPAGSSRRASVAGHIWYAHPFIIIIICARFNRNTNHKNSITFNKERDCEQRQLRGIADMLVHHHLQLAAHLTFNKGCIAVSLFIAAEKCLECSVGEWMNEMS